MYLISAHIENFGKLHDLDLRFSEGLHVIVQPNGWGKSTLASFLCAMFYGLGNSRKKDPDTRKLYTPWQGGPFGGSLVFRTDRGAYRVLRTFGAKSREDTFFLYDAETGLPSGDYTEALGRELFGIDAASFARSVYMPQLLSGSPSAPAPAGGSTSARAGHAAPLPTLPPAAPDVRARITDLGGEDADLRRCDSACAALRKEADALDPDRRGGAIRKASETLERLQADAVRIPALEENVRALAQRHEDLRRQLQAAAQEQASLHQRSADLGRSMEASRILRERALAENEYALAEEELSRIRAQKTAMEARLSEAESRRRAVSAPSGTEALEAQRRDLDEQIRDAQTRQLRIARRGSLLQQEIREDREDLHRRREQADAWHYRIAAASGTVPLFCVLAFLFLLLAGFLFAGEYGLLPLLLSLAAAGLSAAAAWYFHDLRAAQAAGEEALDADSGRLAGKQDRLHELVRSSEALRVRLSRLEAEQQAVCRRIEEISRGPAAADAETAALQAQLEDLATAEAAARDRLHAAAVRKDARAAQAGTSPDEEEALLATSHLAGDEPLTLAELSEELLALQRETETLQQEERSCREQLDTAEEQLSHCRESAAASEETKRQIAEMTDRLRLLQAAQACLRDAASSYSRQYMLPFLEAFESYYDRLSGDPLLFHSDTSLGITAEAEGLPREFPSFSTGSRDLLEICRHLALCDSMYRGEKPFLILDDPFVNLDDARLGAALQLIRELAQDRQILYLTCHESRIP